MRVYQTNRPPPTDTIGDRRVAPQAVSVVLLTDAMVCAPQGLRSVREGDAWLRGSCEEDIGGVR